MTLDLRLLVPQIAAMGDSLKRTAPDERLRLDLAVRTFNAFGTRAADLEARRMRGRLAWPLPGVVSETLSEVRPLPPLPEAYHALACDGSHIDPDRHRSAACCLMNVGSVSLSYGPGSDADLSCEPRLFFGESAMSIPSPDPSRDGVPLEGPVLAARSAVEECRALASLARRTKPDRPAVAFLDGSLVLWDLEQQKVPDFVVDSLLGEGLLPALDEMRSLVADGRRFAVCSYISSPSSTEFINLLRLALCPMESPDCERCRKDRKKRERECEQITGLHDSAVFGKVLRAGERSAIFRSHSRVVDRHYDRHPVCFFYLNVFDEVARIEVPEWIARQTASIDLLHAVAFEQCRLGDGYPVALAEAHEKAVVTVADREQFWRLVDITMEERGMVVTGSAKSRSKRRPFV